MNKVQQTLLPIKLEQREERLTSLAGLVVVEELATGAGVWRRCAGGCSVWLGR